MTSVPRLFPGAFRRISRHLLRTETDPSAREEGAGFTIFKKIQLTLIENVMEKSIHFTIVKKNVYSQNSEICLKSVFPIFACANPQILEFEDVLQMQYSRGPLAPRH